MFAKCGTNRGSILYEYPCKEEYIVEDEYLESNNGIYFAYLQNDTNFIIYKVRT